MKLGEKSLTNRNGDGSTLRDERHDCCTLSHEETHIVKSVGPNFASNASYLIIPAKQRQKVNMTLTVMVIRAFGVPVAEGLVTVPTFRTTK